MNTVELVFNIQGIDRDILLAQLSDVGCDAFEELEAELRAYVRQDLYDPKKVKDIAEAVGYSFEEHIVEPRNWNALWEEAFEPVVVPGFCTVRANFHPAATNTPHEIVITPKMSFGTGHHSTTRLMLAAMRDIDFQGKEVVDFGTGTGILAILASKLGAKEAIAIDNDDWSVENALENVAANDISNVNVRHGSLEVIGSTGPFDIMLANINRHILLQYMAEIRLVLAPGGYLLLSGILTTDESIIVEAAANEGFCIIQSFNEGDWMALKFTA